MTDFGVFIVSAALTFLVGVVAWAAVVPLVHHWRWERRQAQRRRRYL